MASKITYADKVTKKVLTEENIKKVITYGFNTKATLTIISNENDDIILELQEDIQDIFDNKIERQEIKLKKKYGKKHIYEEIAMKILTILAKL